MIGAIVILPVTRHMLSARDAVAAGLLAGPLAMLPALLFFICMVAYYPAVQSEALRSEEHTSELQSLMRISYAVFCLKKKKSDTQPNQLMPQLIHKSPYI